MKNGSAFEVGSVDSLSLKSFAAFILKGDDLEKLEDFLVENGIVDFRIAFAIWGAMFGFSKIPKNYFNLLSECENAGYEMAVYKHIRQAIHDKSIASEPQIQQSFPMPVSLTKEDTPGGSMLANFFEKYPAARRWEEKLQSLLNECGGFTANFITKFKTTKAKELGGIVKGVKKPDADNFFEKAFSVKRHSTKLFKSTN